MMLRINDITQLWLGIQGENEAREILIDVTDWLAGNPNGSFTVWVKRPGETTARPTGATYDPDEGVISWKPDSVETYVAGESRSQRDRQIYEDPFLILFNYWRSKIHLIAILRNQF